MFVLVVCLFIMGIVNAGSCDDDQIIMKLFQDSNSHGALWDDVNYNYDVCYNEIFGNEYIGENPHECIYNNEAIDPGLDDYSIDLETGWNLISPKTKTLTVAQLEEYCDVSIIWEWIGGKYSEVEDVMEGGLGYYVSSMSPCTVNYEGERYTDNAPRMEVGWNYVGVGLNTLIEELNVSNINCQVLGTIWGFVDGVYSIIDTSYFEGGKGYSIYCVEGSTTAIDLRSIASQISVLEIPENVLLWLNNETNSHVSVNAIEGSYDVPVCYGDEECVIRTDSCENGEEVVVSLYQEENSHVSLGDDVNYPIKVCCKTSSDIYWADANGARITDQEINIGDRIQAVAIGAVSGTFNIKENDALVDDDIIDIVGEVIDGKLVGKWEITQTDLDKTEDFEEFYFKVNNGGDKSDSISINGTYDDDPMNVTIISPECGDNFTKGSDVTIEIGASDEDDFIEGNVTINNVIVESFTNGGITFNYTFDSSGSYQIVVNAINSRRKRARHIANIIIFDININGKYLAACILKPKDFSDLDEKIVEFDASTTRAIEIVDGSITEITPDESLTRFKWYWTFYPKDGDNTYGFPEETGEAAYKFFANFRIAGDNSANLKVDFD